MHEGSQENPPQTEAQSQASTNIDASNDSTKAQPEVSDSSSKGIHQDNPASSASQSSVDNIAYTSALPHGNPESSPGYLRRDVTEAQVVGNGTNFHGINAEGFLKPSCEESQDIEGEPIEPATKELRTDTSTCVGDLDGLTESNVNEGAGSQEPATGVDTEEEAMSAVELLCRPSRPEHSSPELNNVLLDTVAETSIDNVEATGVLDTLYCDEGEQLIENPSEDILSDLETALSGPALALKGFPIPQEFLVSPESNLAS
ncbi:hypothetical protein HGRIS_009757 [Hohenbuehelia grisea]|uniref:Uncharacterized protein n=1 Tax=Hohenbuehelia grisea TaxID=104357 RepID=A0ABR3J2K4_9AGAR